MIDSEDWPQPSELSERRTVDECVASGQHMSHVDDDGYCMWCGYDDPLEDK